MAEREGFEPSTGVASTRFPVVLLRPLGHLSVDNHFKKSAYNIQVSDSKRKHFEAVISTIPQILAERQGFEPWDGKAINGFRDRPIQPLWHLSA